MRVLLFYSYGFVSLTLGCKLAININSCCFITKISFPMSIFIDAALNLVFERIMWAIFVLWHRVQNFHSVCMCRDILSSPEAGPITLFALLTIVSFLFSIVLSVSMKFSPGGRSPPTWLF